MAKIRYSTKIFFSCSECNSVYNLQKYKESQTKNCIILSARDAAVRNLNNRIFNFLDGDIRTYYSIDYAIHKGVDQTDQDIHLNYSIDMLNSITEGLSLHCNYNVDTKFEN